MLKILNIYVKNHELVELWIFYLESTKSEYGLLQSLLILFLLDTNGFLLPSF